MQDYRSKEEKPEKTTKDLIYWFGYVVALVICLGLSLGVLSIILWGLIELWQKMGFL